MQEDKTTTELLKWENYTFHVMRPEHAKEALHMTTEQFITQNNIIQSLFVTKPELLPKNYQSMFQFWELHIDECATNGISVVICDSSNNNEVVGATLSKDLTSPWAEKERPHEDLAIGPLYELVDQMMVNFDQPTKDLLETKGKVVDIWGVAIKSGHIGKKLLSKMVDLSCRLSKEKGFTHGFCFAVNIKTESCMKRLNFQKLSSMDVSTSIYKGEKRFGKVQGDDRYASLWIKQFD